MSENNTCYTHRVGTITCGLVFILYGILFLLHMVLPGLNYMFIFGLWPVILIFLGIEILLGCRYKDSDKKRFVYDFPAVLLIMMMMLFTMLMALVDYGMQHGGYDGFYLYYDSIYYSSSNPISLL